MLRTLTGSFLFACCCTQLFCQSVTLGDDWLRFRGPNGSGVSSEKNELPTQWSPKANVQWSSPLPGAGVSSPIVVGDKILVTCYSGYGLDIQDPGDINELKRHVVCYDLNSGEKLWQSDIVAVQPEDPYRGAGVPAHGYASNTPVSDGQHVFAFLGKSGVYAYDLEGNELWHTSVGTESDPRRWGSSCSPILFGDLVIVTAAAESQAVVGLDKATGKEVWRQEATGLDNMWGTPVLVKVDDQRTDLVMSVPGEVWGLDPTTGDMRWYSETNKAQQTHSSIIADGESPRVFAFSGRGGGSVAVEVGGAGDTSEQAIIWKGRETDRFASPVSVGSKIYLISNGILNVIDKETGDSEDQIRLEGAARSRSDYASPIVAGDHLYYLNGAGQVFVFQLGEVARQISANRVTSESESFGGSPAVSDGKIIIRSNKNLYCVIDKGDEVNPDDNKVASEGGEGSGGFGGGRRPGGQAGGGRAGRGGAGGSPGGNRQGGNRQAGNRQAGNRQGGGQEDSRPERPQRPKMANQ